MVCSCNTWIFLRSTTRSTFRQLMIFVTMMQLKLSLQCSDKKGSIPCRVRVGEYFATQADVFCDSRVAVYTRRDYVSLSFSPQICGRNTYVTTNFRINIILYNSYIDYVAVAVLTVKDDCSGEWR